MSIQKKFQLFLVCISYLEMSSNLSLSAPRLPFYWTPLFFVILGYFLFCHPRTLFSPVILGLVSSSVMFGLFLPLSSSGLTRGSLDCRLKADNDKKEKKARQ